METHNENFAAFWLYVGDGCYLREIKLYDYSGNVVYDVMLAWYLALD